jgi:putative MATE family efflux protein
VKKGLLASFVEGIREENHGESYENILRYSWPELVTQLLLYSLPFLLDSYFISFLRSTSTYATLGASSTLVNSITKVAEAMSVGTVILVGQFNGRANYPEVGRVMRDSFWVTLLVGGMLSAFLYVGAPAIYTWYGVPEEMIALGVPYLRLRAVGILLMFVFLAFVSFLRGIKNTKTPMKLFIFGTLVFLVFDYLFILGGAGFPAMGFLGSAAASVVQYFVMVVTVVIYIMRNEKYRKYGIDLFSSIRSFSYIKELLWLSWPVLIDKATISIAYIWLGKMLAPMGVFALASFTVVRDMQNLALTPGKAFAQVITFLVSNEYGSRNWRGIKSTIKKTVFSSLIMVLALLIIFSIFPTYVIHLLDKKGEFTEFAARAFPLLSVLAFFDLLQLVLSGALRGASNVKTVMITRLVVSLFFFVPVSYFFSTMPMADDVLKFVLIYGSFYVGTGLMSMMYIYRFRSEAWKTQE